MKTTVRILLILFGLCLANQTVLAQFTGGSFDGYTSSRSDDILYDGTTAVVTGAELPDIVHDLTIDNPGGVTLTKSIELTGTLTILRGILNLNGNTILLGELATVVEVPSNTASGIVGELKTTRRLNDLSRGVNVAGLGFQITTQVPLGQTTIARSHGPQILNLNNTGIGRFYDVNPANNQNLNAIIDFHYDASELSGIPEKDLVLFRTKDFESGSVGKAGQSAPRLSVEPIWEIVGGTVEPQQRTVCKGGVGDFSRWTLGRGYVLLAEDEIEFEGNVQSVGDIHCNNDITFDKGKGGHHQGNLTALDDIKIERGNTITGGLFAGDKIKVNDDVEVTGEIQAGAAVLRIDLSNPQLEAGKADIKVPKGGSVSLEPGAYDKVEVGKRGRLHLSLGVYNFRKLETDDAAVIEINAAGGVVDINVVADIKFAEDTEIMITPDDQAGSNRVTFTTLDDSRVKFGKDALILGTFIAPYAKVTLAEECRFKGAIYAHSIVVDDGVTLVPHSYSQPLAKPRVNPNSEAQPVVIAAVTDYGLSPNYPNPFNPTTKIRFHLKEAGEATLIVYDLHGREVRRLVGGTIQAGSHEVVWDAKDIHGQPAPSGIYFYRLRVNGFEETRRMTLLK